MINYLLLAIIGILVLASVYIVRLTKSVKIMKQIIKEKEIKEKRKEKKTLTLTVMKSRLIYSKTNS
jgi:cbb3-type cytochrome oxidase cytochrome c subunit